MTVRFSYLDRRLLKNSRIRNGDKVYKSGVINMHMSDINILLKKTKYKVAKIVGIFIQKHTFQRQLPSFLSPWSYSGGIHVELASVLAVNLNN